MVKSATSYIVSQFILMTMLASIGLQVAATENSIEPVKQIFPAPSFELVNLNDKKIRLEDYRGKVVAVNFWASWCPPCRKELPSMQRTYEAFKDKGFVILAVNIGESWDTVAPFLGNFTLKFPILFDSQSKIVDQWKVFGLPSTFILDKKGNVTHRINGGRDWDDPVFRKALLKIIEAK